MAERKFEERWERFRDLVEHLLQEPGRNCPEDVVWYPATDAYETEQHLVIRMDVSGIKRNEIRLEIQERLLTVRGIRRDLGPGGRRTFHMMEIAMGPFARSIQLPARFAGAAAIARYEDGILHIELTAGEDKGPLQIVIEGEPGGER